MDLEQRGVRASAVLLLASLGLRSISWNASMFVLGFAQASYAHTSDSFLGAASISAVWFPRILIVDAALAGVAIPGALGFVRGRSLLVHALRALAAISLLVAAALSLRSALGAPLAPGLRTALSSAIEGVVAAACAALAPPHRVWLRRLALATTAISIAHVLWSSLRLHDAGRLLGAAASVGALASVALFVRSGPPRPTRSGI